MLKTCAVSILLAVSITQTAQAAVGPPETVCPPAVSNLLAGWEPHPPTLGQLGTVRAGETYAPLFVGKAFSYATAPTAQSTAPAAHRHTLRNLIIITFTVGILYVVLGAAARK